MVDVGTIGVLRAPCPIYSWVQDGFGASLSLSLALAGSSLRRVLSCLPLRLCISATLQLWAGYCLTKRQMEEIMLAVTRRRRLPCRSARRTCRQWHLAVALHRPFGIALLSLSPRPSIFFPFSSGLGPLYHLVFLSVDEPKNPDADCNCFSAMPHHPRGNLSLWKAMWGAWAFLSGLLNLFFFFWILCFPCPARYREHLS